LSIENDLLSVFIRRLKEREELDKNLVDALGTALRRVKLPKADEIVDMISEGTGEAIA
jgi:hypothetical protein